MIIAIFGFDGYAFPAEHVSPCQFCSYSSGGQVFAWTEKKVAACPLLIQH